MLRDAGAAFNGRPSFAPAMAPVVRTCSARRLSPIRGRIVRGPSKRKLRTEGAAFGLPHRTRSRRRRARAEVRRSGLDVRLDVIHRLLDGGDFLGFLVGNFGFEFLFERHHQFHGVERIRAQIVNERGIRRDVLFLDSQLIDHDLLDALFDAAHETVPPGTLAFEVGTDPSPLDPHAPRTARTVRIFLIKTPKGRWRLLDLQIATRKTPYYKVPPATGTVPPAQPMRHSKRLLWKVRAGSPFWSSRIGSGPADSFLQRSSDQGRSQNQLMYMPPLTCRVSPVM